ncbi:MAG: putative toxin-antitoxin system toxin component, PIN family [Magnetococcales bacterium]|nr:putative toxin-antitoxin system toxin component, PIN family [Magnetococcales bacterium]
MTILRPVLDTNILLSALFFHNSSLTWLRHSWQSEIIRPLVSRDTATELIRVLHYPKFNLTSEEQEDILNDYLPWCETIKITKPVKIPNCRDPHDLQFLELAMFANADALVSGDKDLLILAENFPIPILNPASFQKLLPG